MSDARTAKDGGGAVVPTDEAARLISNAAHQLRAPLAALRGAVDLLHDDVKPADAEQAELLEMVMRNCGRLESAITDVAVFARLMHGCVALAPAEFDVRAAVDQAMVALQKQANARGVTFSVTVTGSTGGFCGAVDAFTTVFTNLSANAVKFGPRKGTVTVTVAVALESLHVRVEDHGVTISATDRSQLFQPFFHRARGDDAQSAGIGLGLFIAQRMARLHGGDCAYSGEGPGNSFTATLRRLR